MKTDIINALKDIDGLCEQAGISNIRRAAQKVLTDLRFEALGVNNSQEARDFYGNDWWIEADQRIEQRLEFVSPIAMPFVNGDKA